MKKELRMTWICKKTTAIMHALFLLIITDSTNEKSWNMSHWLEKIDKNKKLCDDFFQTLRGNFEIKNA